MKEFIKKIGAFAAACAMLAACACGEEDAGNSAESLSESESVSTPSTEHKVQYSLDEVIQNMNSSVWRDDSLTDDGEYGLSDISAVGADKDAMDEVLYPIPDGLEVVDYSAMSGGTDYARLLNAFNEAKRINGEGRKAVVVLPENGTLHINSTLASSSTYTYNLEGYNGLYVDGNGCTIELSYEEFAYRGFIGLTNCEDVHFNDLTVDYAVPTAVNGVITDVDNDNYTVTVDVGPEFDETMNRAVTYGGRLLSYVEFSRINRIPVQGGNFCTASETFLSGYTAKKKEGGGYEVVVRFGSAYYGFFSDVGLGQYANLAFSMYVYNGFAYTSCKDVYMEGVTIATCPGMGVVGTLTENVRINRLKIAVPEGSGRLMTTTADGLHFGECFGEVKVTNSLIEYCHDDALNIKSGYYYKLTNVNARAKEVVVSRKTSGITRPEKGNVIEFYDANTFAKLGSGTVATVSGNEAAYTITFEESLLKQNADAWDDCVATNISKTAKFTFRNNVVRNKRNRGLLIQVRDAEIEGNSFFNVGHGSISVHTSLDVFNEATVPDNVSIKNNKFVNNNYLLGMAGDISVFARATQLGPVGTIKHVAVENNYIARNGNAGVSLQACSDSSVKNNLFFNNGRVTTGEVYESALELNNAGDLEVVHNYAYNNLDSETYAGIKTNGLTSPETITLTGNINLGYEVITAEVGTTEVGTLGSPVAIDGDLSDWNGQGTEIAMVGHSLATGRAIDPNEYADVFGVKTCKIGWTDDGVYIAFAVKDNAPLYKSTNNFWTGDCFEFFLSTVLDMPNADMQLYRNRGDVVQLACVPSWKDGWCVAESRTGDDIIANKSSVRCACVDTADGYAGEVFLPFSLFTSVRSAIDAGEEVAACFVFADGDRDDIGRKRVQVSNVPHFVEAWKTKTAKMPRFKFVK